MDIEKTHNVTRNQFTGKDFSLLTVTNNPRAHSNVTLQGSDNISSLLLLVPTDSSVKQQNSDNDTEINPVTKTTSKQDGQFHNYYAR